MMPRANKSEKFFFKKAGKSGLWKNQVFIMANHRYEGGMETLCLQDLIDFLKEKEIDPLTVKVESNFFTYAVAK